MLNNLLRHLTSFFIISFCLCSQIFAQSQWQQQNSNTDIDLVGVHFINDQIGWAVGGEFFGDGIIIYTENGGETWQEKELDESFAHLFDITFVGNAHGWAVGVDGTLLRTEDGGDSWALSEGITDDFNSDSDLQAVSFPDSLHGWIAMNSSSLIRTDDGGGSWERIEIDRLNADLHDIQFLNDSTGYVVGGDNSEDLVYKTTDAGTSWEKLEPAGEVNLVYNLHFLSEDVGWISGGSGYIAKTEDGGETWTLQDSNADNSLESIFFTEESRGWAVGTWNTTFTTDGGENWSSNFSSSYRVLADVYFTSPENGWAVGEDGRIFKWDPTATTTEEDFMAVKSFNLHQNFPNPFNPKTNIPFTIPEYSHVRLEVYNMLGQRVSVLVDEVKTAGKHSVSFDASGLNSGMYIYKLRAGEQVSSKSLMLIK